MTEIKNINSTYLSQGLSNHSKTLNAKDQNLDAKDLNEAQTDQKSNDKNKEPMKPRVIVYTDTENKLISEKRDNFGTIIASYPDDRAVTYKKDGKISSVEKLTFNKK